jgi:hypothetical protein
MMTQFIIINPHDATVKVVEAKDLTDACKRVGLDKNEVDYGCLHRHDNGETINIVVFEYGLLVPPERGKYFSIGAALFEGGAVIFAADAMGETVSIKRKPPVMFYRSHVEVEEAIARGEVRRPETSVNGRVVWSWPNRRENEGES